MSVVCLDGARRRKVATGSVREVDAVATIGEARVMQGVLAPDEWRRWVRRHGLEVYGMPGEEFAGPAIRVGVDDEPG